MTSLDFLLLKILHPALPIPSSSVYESRESTSTHMPLRLPKLFSFLFSPISLAESTLNKTEGLQSAQSVFPFTT